MTRFVVAFLAGMALFVVAETARGVASARERERGEDVLARSRWFYGQRAFPRASIPRGAYLRARRQAAKLPHFPGPRPDRRKRAGGRPRAANASFAWTSIGPRAIDTPATLDDSGRVTSLAVQTTQIVYAGAAGGGVWKTTDRGLHWSPVFDGQPSMSIGAVAIDPNNASNVFAGTGEANFAADSYYGTGLYKSPNAGASWFRLGGTRFEDCAISAIVVKPGDPKTIGVALGSAGVGGRTGCAITRTGVHVSTDGGVTWALEAPRPGGFFAPAEATDLAISPGNASVWFAGMRNGSVWRSTDSGQTWGPVMIDAKGARTSIAISPSSPKYIVAAVEVPPKGSTAETVDVLVSGDGGTTWSKPLPVPASATLCGTNGQCWYDLTVTFDPSTPRTFYLGTVGLFRYNRPIGGGWSFSQVASAIHSDFHALAHDSLGDLWTGSDGGVNTLRWTPLTQFIVGRSADLAITEFEPGISGDLSQIVGGTQDNGTVLFTGPQQWTQIFGADGGFSASDVANRSTVVASSQNFSFRRSTDSGATWTTITPTRPTGDTAQFYSPLVNEPGAPNTLYAGSQTLWRSTSGGVGTSAWAAASPLFTNKISAIGVGSTSAAGTNATAYVGFATGGVRASTNITSLDATPPTTPTWAAAAAVLPNRPVTDIWVNPANAQEAYVAVSGFGTAHLFHTTDGAANWDATAGTLPNTPVNAVTVDTSGAFPIIYVGTDIGIFASADGGATWAVASTNLPATVVMDLLIDPANDALIAATHGRGAYTARLSQAPPFAAITTPAAITDPVVARFNVPVQGVTTSNFVLRVQGTVVDLAGSVSCEDASGTTVGCAGGPVALARLQPARPLIPGERYVATINPAGAATITDGLGTNVLSAFRGFRASLTETETSAAAAYAWQIVKPVGTPGPLGGSYAQHHLARASASYAFDGSQVAWITLTGPDQGIGDVFIDGVLVKTVDHYAPTRTYNVRETFSGLTPGRHVIRIEPTGKSNPAATDTFVAVDGMQVGDTTADPNPTVTYRWQPDSAFDSTIGYVRSDLGATATASATSVTFTFRGPAVVWHTIAGPDQGQARATIDGVDQGVVDNYASVRSVIDRTYGGFADVVHTMMITVQGKKQPASTGTYVAVKGWDVK